MVDEVMPDPGIHLALDYLKFLVVEESIPPEVAEFYMNMSVVNKTSLHYFLTGALVDYFIHLNQQPDDQETESVH